MTDVVRLVHGPAAAPDAPRVERLATRAVVRRGDDVLLLRGTAGDYRFPGGGVDVGESVADALRRELLEECGVAMSDVGEELVAVLDERPAREPGHVFAQTSLYVRCSVEGDLGPVSHDLRERTLGLVPLWVPLAEALEANVALRRDRAVEGHPGGPDTAEDPDALAWIERETLVLELLAAGSGAGRRPEVGPAHAEPVEEPAHQG